MEQVIATDTLSLKQGLIKAPELPEAWPAWREQLQALASDAARKFGPVKYDAAAQAWASRCYAQGFIMLWDNELIDHTSGEWKVEAFCDRAVRDFGGYDLVVLWSNYPLSGVDPRHQLAYYDDLPGGRDGLKKAVARFHARGVRVLVDHKPWVPGVPSGFGNVEDAFAGLVVDCDLDGVYLDCSDGPSDYFRETMARVAGPGKIFISEAPASLDPFGSEIGCWQQMSDDSTAPGTYRNRWLDRNQIVCESRRYFHDPVRELQRGWMNGGGQVIWENVFGYWASYSARCRSWMRLLLPAQRYFADWFISGEWLPHVGGGTATGVYVSEWNHGGTRLWTVVNRRGHTVEKGVLTLPAQPGCQYVDVITGRPFEVLSEKDGKVTLGGRIERDGLAGVLAVKTITPDLAAFLHAQFERFTQADWTAEPWPNEHRKTELPHVLRSVQPAPTASLPTGMIRLPDYSGWMLTRYRMRECGYIAGAVDEKHVYDAFEKPCPYSRVVRIEKVAMDKFPVTNADFLRFIQATGYTPRDSRNFLKHWHQGQPEPGQELHPVVYVSLSDARAYAHWAGKRLPREEEWQLAAQGLEKRLWPWGSEWDASRCNSATTGTTPVNAFPTGCTPEGFMDLSGNVWELTESERSDGHTRYQILKGGCWYRVDNSHWLFDTGAQPADWGAKHLLLCDAWDRCSTIGFRCAVDLME
ncbi:MAG: SUMF1/EgtB/PvdO family nonheme iron enzyme [Verrucomicrobiota bacterium]|nr:SUMF1/EgtB/PvdO family nonheme iron enzyme [Verrucomicrobiota bacterium]